MAQILFRNANVLDCDAGHAQPGCSVLIEDDRIVEVHKNHLTPTLLVKLDFAAQHFDSRNHLLS